MNEQQQNDAPATGPNDNAFHGEIWGGNIETITVTGNSVGDVLKQLGSAPRVPRAASKPEIG